MLPQLFPSSGTKPLLLELVEGYDRICKPGVNPLTRYHPMRGLYLAVKAARTGIVYIGSLI